MTLQQFKKMAYNAMIDSDMPTGTYFYCQSMIWHRQNESEWELDEIPEYNVCFYLPKNKNVSAGGRTPLEAIENAVLKYKHSILIPDHLTV